MEIFKRIYSRLVDVRDAQRREKQILAAYRQVFGTEYGKIVLDDLANQFCFVGPTFDPAVDKVEVALVNEGSRNVVLYILGMVRRDGNMNSIKEVTGNE
jgi:hypothetical protein